MVAGRGWRVAERIAAVLLGLFDLAMSIPDIPTRSRVDDGLGVATEPEFWIAAGYVGVTVGLVLAIAVGKTRALRLASWMCLVMWGVLKCGWLVY